MYISMADTPISTATQRLTNLVLVGIAHNVVWEFFYFLRPPPLPMVLEWINSLFPHPI